MMINMNPFHASGRSLEIPGKEMPPYLASCIHLPATALCGCNFIQGPTVEQPSYFCLVMYFIFELQCTVNEIIYLQTNKIYLNFVRMRDPDPKTQLSIKKKKKKFTAWISCSYRCCPEADFTERQLPFRKPDPNLGTENVETTSSGLPNATPRLEPPLYW